MSTRSDATTERLESFEARACYLVRGMAGRRPDPAMERTAWVKQAVYYAMAKLEAGVEEEEACRLIGSCIDEPAGGAMFLRHVLMDAYLRYGARFPDTLREKLKRKMTRFNYAAALAGGTENHKMMEASAGCLAAQTWREDMADAEKQKQACETYLASACERYVSWGMIEYDSPTYFVLYLTTLLSVRDFTDNGLLRRQAEMTVDWMLANMAGEWLDGYYIASSLRMYGPMLDPYRSSGSAIAAWLYFGGRTPDIPGDWGVEATYAITNAVSPYRCPGVLAGIAADRSVPFTTKEGHDKNGAFNPPQGYDKTTYVAPAFGLSSQYDGNGRLGWSDQMTRWILRWVSEEPCSTFLMKHPKQDELFLGSTPFEQVLQHEGTLMAVYNIPEVDPRPFIEGPLPLKSVFARLEYNGRLHIHGGGILFAVSTAGPLECSEEEVKPGCGYGRLRSPGRKNGLVLEVVEPSRYRREEEAQLSREERSRRELERFAAELPARTLLNWSGIDLDRPSIRYTNLNGDRLVLEFGGERSVNGIPEKRENWPLMENPYMKQQAGGFPLVMKYGGKTRTYDFAAWTVEEKDG